METAFVSRKLIIYFHFIWYGTWIESKKTGNVHKRGIFLFLLVAGGVRASEWAYLHFVAVNKYVCHKYSHISRYFTKKKLLFFLFTSESICTCIVSNIFPFLSIECVVVNKTKQKTIDNKWTVNLTIKGYSNFMFAYTWWIRHVNNIEINVELNRSRVHFRSAKAKWASLFNIINAKKKRCNFPVIIQCKKMV